ncbi:hypothetical protein VspSTUT11_44340 [Vibrio sp. STUT-A11]|nr:hypothetical protein VspSTUT11_44340 [Vibrio sp. STUT-A11]
MLRLFEQKEQIQSNLKMSRPNYALHQNNFMISGNRLNISTYSSMFNKDCDFDHENDIYGLQLFLLIYFSKHNIFT